MNKNATRKKTCPNAKAYNINGLEVSGAKGQKKRQLHFYIYNIYIYFLKFYL